MAGTRRESQTIEEDSLDTDAGQENDDQLDDIRLPLSEPRAIADYGFAYWRDHGDRDCGIITFIASLPQPQQNAVRDFIITHEEAQVWSGIVCFAENPRCQALQTHHILDCVGDLTWLFRVFLTGTMSTERWCIGMLRELQNGYREGELVIFLVLCYQTLGHFSQG